MNTQSTHPADLSKTSPGIDMAQPSEARVEAVAKALLDHTTWVGGSVWERALNQACAVLTAADSAGAVQAGADISIDFDLLRELADTKQAAPSGEAVALAALADLCSMASGGWDLPPSAVARIGELAANAGGGLADPGAYDRGWSAGIKVAIALAMDRECMACEQFAKDLSAMLAASPPPSTERDEAMRKDAERLDYLIRQPDDGPTLVVWKQDYKSEPFTTLRACGSINVTGHFDDVRAAIDAALAAAPNQKGALNEHE